jgi:hypothetical protein
MNLDGKTFRVSTGSEHGVVTADTRLELRQKGARVLGRYRGGTIVRGYLIGRIWGAEFRFRYAQREAAGGVHGGSSVCELRQLPDGRLRMSEHFTWATREGSGTNVFEEIVP